MQTRSEKRRKKNDAPVRSATISERKTASTRSNTASDALGRELIGVCMATLSRYGFTARQLSRLAREAIGAGDEIPTASKLFQDIHVLGDLATEWSEHREYVDPTGRPKILPIKGPSPSFQALVEKHFSGRAVAEIVKLAAKTRVLEQVKPHRVAQFGACVMLTGNPFLQLVRAIHSIRWLLSTAAYNGEPSPIGTWPDRQVCGFASEEDFPDFIKAMRQPMVNLIEMGNRWLAFRGAVTSCSAKKVIMMGMHAYVFQDRSIHKGE